MDSEKTVDEEKSDLRVVLQFFIVPLALVFVLVAVFFGLQFARSRHPDPKATLRSLEKYKGFLAGFVGDLKRWQYGYDLSLLMRGHDPEEIRRILPDLSRAFREAGAHQDRKLRRYLALALGASQDARAAGPLREGLQDDDAETRMFSAYGLARTGDRSVLPDLRKALLDGDAGVRSVAAFGLGLMEDGESAAALERALEDPDEGVRWNAALSLARLGDAAAGPVLIALLENALPRAVPAAGEDKRPRDEAARRDRALNAIRGLALLKPPAARGLLDRLAASAEDAAVREAATLAVAAYGAGQAATVR